MILATLTWQVGAQTDAISRYFNKYLEDDRFTVVYVSPQMIQMVSTMSEESDDPEAKEILAGLQGIRILTTETTPLKFYEEALKTLTLKDYEVLMEVRDKDENVRFLAQKNGPKIKELLLLVGGSDNFVFMSLVGEIDLKQISKLSKSMEIEGLEHLEELEAK